MDYLTTGALLRERGVAYIALGSFFISLAWHLLRNADKAHTFLVTIRFCKSPWLSDILVFLAVTVCLIPGTRLVGTGGSLTTQGWNTLGKHDQKVALLAAFAGEWTINDALRKSPPLCVPSNDPNFGKTHCLYPRFRTTVSRQILTSALFRSEERL